MVFFFKKTIANQEYFQLIKFFLVCLFVMRKICPFCWRGRLFVLDVLDINLEDTANVLGNGLRPNVVS